MKSESKIVSLLNRKMTKTTKVRPQLLEIKFYSRLKEGSSSSPPGAAPPAATVVIVVCIAALVVIVVIGVYRIHATHQEGSREDEDEVKDPEADWDNSALTITVNPMEVTHKLLTLLGILFLPCVHSGPCDDLKYLILFSPDLS